MFPGCFVPENLIVGVDYQGAIEQIELTYYYNKELVLETYAGVECLPLDEEGTCHELMRVLVPRDFQRIKKIIESRNVSD